MNKILATGLLALCALAFTQQQASAWVNSRFGIGFNWNIKWGANHLGCRLWHNGQPPAPGYYNYYGNGNYPYGGHATAPQGYMPPSYAYEAPMYMPSYAQPMYTAPYQYSYYGR